MEELHRIHKDVPFGYWVFWGKPIARLVGRALRALTAPQTDHQHIVTLR